MEEYMFIQRKEDYEAIVKWKEKLKDVTLNELQNQFNTTVDLGFVGSREQAYSVIAIHQEFLKRIKDSPVKIEKNILISFKGKIKSIINNKIIYERKNAI